MASDLNIFGWKMSDFVSFLLFGFTLVIKQKFLFLKSLEYFNFFNKKMMSNFNMSCQTVSDFV